MSDRKPDTVVLSFKTTVDVVVDLQTGTFKCEYEGPDEIDAGPYYSTIWAEGELLGSIEANWGPQFTAGLEPADVAALRKALEIVQQAPEA